MEKRTMTKKKTTKKKHIISPKQEISDHKKYIKLWLPLSHFFFLIAIILT